MMAVLVALPFCLLAVASAQQAGSQKQEEHVPLSFATCTKAGGCKGTQTTLTMDAQWRWLHDSRPNQFQNCLQGTAWDKTIAPDGLKAASNCALEGMTSSDYATTYGVTPIKGGVSLNFVNGQSVGSRMYMMEEGKQDKYMMFKLLNKEFRFDVDVSTLECGLNGAVYFVEMKADGGLGEGNNTAGAKYGTGYCDAQCPHDLKFIHGEGNVKDWHTTKAGPVGAYGNCCSELDIWEANAYATAFTTHACDTTGPLKCTTDEKCGETAPECKCCDLEDCPCCKRYSGVCDKDGCDFNSYRMGDKKFFGKGAGYTVDTSKPISVVTQFITTDGTDTGDLKEMRRLYVQDGKVIQNSKISPDAIANLPAGASADSLTDATCQAGKKAFDNPDDFTKKGGMAGMGKAMKRGMVLVLSLWDDMLTKMDWLDSETPSKIHPKNFPGTKRGPCSMQAGDPNTLRSQSPNSKVHYTNIMVGEIDSTYGPNVGAELLDVVATPAPKPAPTLPPWQQQQQQQQQQQPVQPVQQPVQPVQQPAQPVQQPVQPVPAVPAGLQPMTPAGQVTGGTAVDGFCCFYGPNPSNMCANCQSKDTSPWNSNPLNCAKSGGKYCSGIVRLFSTEKELPAVQGRLSQAQMP